MDTGKPEGGCLLQNRNSRTWPLGDTADWGSVEGFASAGSPSGIRPPDMLPTWLPLPPPC